MGPQHPTYPQSLGVIVKELRKVARIERGNAMRAVFVALAALVGCSSVGYPIVVGHAASGEDIYAIDGYPKTDGTSGPKAARYCQRRGKIAVINDTGYTDGTSFNFSCKDTAAATP